MIEYQKIISLLDNTTNQSSKFRTKDWLESNDESRGKYNAINQIKFKPLMNRLSLCGCSDAYVHVKETIIIPNTAAAAAGASNANKK